MRRKKEPVQHKNETFLVVGFFFLCKNRPVFRRALLTAGRSRYH